MEAWITSVLKDNLLANAVVLANSLRRSGTNRKLAVIVSPNLSAETRIALRKTFDCIFVLQQHDTSKAQCMDAKIFAFSLCCFSKCSYISPECVALESAENIFKGKQTLKIIKCAKTGLVDWSLFMFTPNKELWEYLVDSCETEDNLEELVQTWLENQQLWLQKTEYISDSILTKFSVAANVLLTEETHASIVHFVNVGNDRPFSEQMRSLLNSNAGLLEKVIVTNWLEIFSQPTKNSISYLRDYTSEPVAIVGLSCRYPGANSLEEFWNLLNDGRDAVAEPPSFRWTTELNYHVTEKEKKTNAGFLKDRIDEFDAKFFGTSPKDMAYMDPQVRLLHEVFWEALEDSGIDPLSLHGTHTGVFTGSWLSDYKEMLLENKNKDFYRTYMGVGIGSAAARLSFLLGLTGPSIATESGCSSAMVALDLAVKSLRAGETNLAAVGGVNLLLKPFTSKIMEFVVSPSGRSKTFDADADGFGRAEGCGVLVLKRLSDALKDRDRIWATIRGCAVAQEGPSRSFGTPTVQCEALAMSLALEDANVAPEQVSFVEAHGTGTRVGDPIEVNAIAKAYQSQRRGQPLVIGSVKTNVGHTESCSGITGIMKVVLSIHNQIIPKHLNFNSLNPEIFLDSIPAMIPLEPVPWIKVEGQTRIAGVSSFGITGTDGHVIIEEAPHYSLPKLNFQMERTMHILKISGKSSDALQELLKKYRNLFLERANNEEADSNKAFADAAFSGNVGRATFGHRAFLLAETYREAAQILIQKRYLEADCASGENRQICFLFTGEGLRYVGMARTLYESSPVFRIHFDSCKRILRKLYNYSICDFFGESDASSEKLNCANYSHTAVFCVEYSLFKLWQSWGIHPNYVLGHSLGEYCAAVAAEILTLEDALKLVVELGKLIASLPRRGMLVARCGEGQVLELSRSANIDLDVTAVNTSEQTVVSVDTAKLHMCLESLKERNIKYIHLGNKQALHSKHSKLILDKYIKILGNITPKKGSSNIQYVSGIEGRIVSDISHLNTEYWVRHTREPVRFHEACNALREIGHLDFVEISSEPILSTYVLENSTNGSINCLPSLRKGADDWRTILDSLGRLYLLGHNVSWERFERPYVRDKVSLPFHPFHRQSFWMESNVKDGTDLHPLLGHSISNASSVALFKNDFSIESAPFISDHRIGERILFPGAGYVEMCLTAGHYVASGERLDRMPNHAISIRNFRIEAPLEIKDDESCHIQIIVDTPDIYGNNEFGSVNGFRVRVYHQNSNQLTSDKWILHASSSFIAVPETHQITKLWKPQHISNIILAEASSDATKFYMNANEAGLKFGETFKSIRRFWTIKQVDLNEDLDEVVVETAFPSGFSRYLLHPLIIDAVFQSVFLTKHRYGDKMLKVPVAIGQLTLLRVIEEMGDEALQLLYIHTWHDNGRFVASISIGCKRSPVALFEDIQLIETNVRTIESILEQQSSDIADAWQETWKPVPCTFNSAVQVINVEQVLANDQFQAQLNELRNTGSGLKDDQTDVDRLLFLYILSVLLELGWQPELGERMDAETFCEKWRIKPEFQQLINFFFSVLKEEGEILRIDIIGTAVWRVESLPATPAQLQLESSSLGQNIKLRSKCMETLVGIYENVYKNLAAILKGNISALSILFPSDEENHHLSADTLYQIHPAFSLCNLICKEICESIFKTSLYVNPPQSGRIYRVLEVGSGTGSLTAHMLTWLKNVWGDRFELYFTDISQYFFAKAKEQFREFDRNIKYTVFNIEESPLSQSIPLGYFDMVCAVDVLHATRDLEETLINLRQTLRPGGVLCIREAVKQVRDVTFVFGLLKGYWRFQDSHWRPDHCCVGVDVWEKLFSLTGFVAVHNFPTYLNQYAVITAVANPIANLEALLSSVTVRCSVVFKEEWVIFTDGTSNSRAITSKLTNRFTTSGFKVTVVLTSEEALTVSDFYNGPFKMSVTLKCIARHKEHATGWQLSSDCSANGEKKNANGIIYICGSDMADKTDMKIMALPALNLAKTLVGQRKPPPLFIVTLGVQTVSDDSFTCNPNFAAVLGIAKSLKNEHPSTFVRCLDCEEKTEADHVVTQLLNEIVTKTEPEEHMRVQVAYRNGLRYEPKLTKVSTFTSTQDLKLPTGSNRYHLVLPQSRLIQDLHFNTLKEEHVGEKQIEVKVKAWSLNFKDVLTILKPSEEFEKLNTVGYDFSGVVSKAGPSACFGVGERVFGVNTKEAQLPSHVVIDSQAVLVVPEEMTHWEAATLPAVFATAYHCLITVAKMKKEDTLLIHTASGGVGLAAIQVAKHVGATIIATAGNERKRGFLRSIGIQHVFHSRDTSYEHDVLDTTAGRGVDIVLNSITGSGFKEATLRCCAENARFIEMSNLSIWTPKEVQAIRHDIHYQIVDLTFLKPNEWSYLLNTMRVLLSEGHLKPIPYVKFDGLCIRQALQYFQKAKHIGKVVCTMPDVLREEGHIQVKIPLFSAESAYMITGGLGGIGFEVCKWMLDLGATDVVLVGRSPPKPEMAAEIAGLNAKGFNVSVMLVDIGDYESCKKTIEEIEGKGKILRGIMHCAGVLRDNPLTEQTWQSFEATFNPKVNGTWNLHNLTKKLPLEHFVMFSSVTALIGTPSQSNHAAANCFEDAFIHYRHSLGLPGTTINWGQWAQVGVARELNLPGLLPVSVKRMLNGLEMTLRTQTIQVCFSEFYSYQKLHAFCATFKSYLNKKHWKEDGGNGSQSFRNDHLGVNADVFWDEVDDCDSKEQLMEVFLTHLKSILRTVLCLPSDEFIKDNANLQDLGVDSLLMIELRNSIQNLIGSRLSVSASVLSGCESLGQIADALVDGIEQTADDCKLNLNDSLSPDELYQLLSKDCSLPQNISVPTQILPACLPSEIKTVFVTGASGRLATHIIVDLLNSYESVERVICLLRKGDGQKSPCFLMKQLHCLVDLDCNGKQNKIKILYGDVTMTNIGLSVKEYTQLCGDVDAIIHCAAKTHLSEAYKQVANPHVREDIRSVNVGGTLSILKFATTHKTKHLFYPSTLTAALLGNEGVLSEVWLVPEDFQSGINTRIPGFFLSKAVAEILLKQANERGIPCKLFRFPEISGDSKTGQLDYHTTDYIARYLSFLKLGSMPSLTIPANLVPVDLCAEFSLKLFLSDEAPFEIFNIGHPSPQLELDFVQVAKQEFGIELQLLGWNEFLLQLQKLQDSKATSTKAMHRDVSIAISFLTDAWSMLPQWKSGLSTFFKSEKLLKFIPDYERRILASMDIVKRDLNNLRSNGQLGDLCF